MFEKIHLKGLEFGPILSNLVPRSFKSHTEIHIFWKHFVFIRSKSVNISRTSLEEGHNIVSF